MGVRPECQVWLNFSSMDKPSVTREPSEHVDSGSTPTHRWRRDFAVSRGVPKSSAVQPRWLQFESLSEYKTESEYGGCRAGVAGKVAARMFPAATITFSCCETGRTHVAVRAVCCGGQPLLLAGATGVACGWEEVLPPELDILGRYYSCHCRQGRHARTVIGKAWQGSVCRTPPKFL